MLQNSIIKFYSVLNSSKENAIIQINSVQKLIRFSSIKVSMLQTSYVMKQFHNIVIIQLISVQ